MSHLLLALSLLLPQESPPPDLPKEVRESFDQSVLACMERDHLPGAALVVVKDGKTLFKQGYGLADVAANRRVDPDQTLFRIGSISKALTLLTLTRLIDDGRVNLQDDVEDYFPELENAHSFPNPVRLWNLLTHTTGFDQIGGADRHIFNFHQSLSARKALRPSLEDYLANRKLRRVTPAGAMFRYDTYGSTLAGLILSEVTALPYDRAMDQEMFAPLGMTRSSVEYEPEMAPNMALGYAFLEQEYRPQAYEVYVTTPASSIDATPADMGRLLEALTSDGSNGHGRLFSSEQAHAVLSPQYRPHPEFLGMTHGLFERLSPHDSFERQVPMVGHGGSMLGFSAGLSIAIDSRLGIFFITNRSSEGDGLSLDFGSVIQTVVEALGDVSPRPKFPVPEIDEKRNLQEFEGAYYYGVYCHECTETEYRAGAWRRGSPERVTANQGTLRIDDHIYRPRGDDVFVREDGQRMAFFGRQDGEISFLVFSHRNTIFERAP